MRRLVLEGERVPRFYGRAYVDWLRGHSVAYPVPLHWIVGAWRSFWSRVRFGSPWKCDARRLAVYCAGLWTRLGGSLALPRT